ncbi:histone-lysine n-methyltransferase setmar-like protein [Trichonephila clavipes]|nr:histone-lysine n-methyltransferase setmar-like protein [Trichonephila clavipes]
MNPLDDRLHGTRKMLRWCLNMFEKIVVKYLHKSLKIHTSRRCRLRESIRRKRPQFWQSDDWNFVHNNAPKHRSQLLKGFLTKTRTNVLLYSPYSPDLTPCAFNLFPSIKKHLQERRFVSSDKVKGASQEALREVAKNGFQLYFRSYTNAGRSVLSPKGSSSKPPSQTGTLGNFNMSPNHVTVDFLYHEKPPTWAQGRKRKQGRTKSAPNELRHPDGGSKVY